MILFFFIFRLLLCKYLTMMEEACRSEGVRGPVDERGQLRLNLPSPALFAKLGKNNTSLLLVFYAIF